MTLTYKDAHNNTLTGFSLIDLEKLQKEIKEVKYIIGLLGTSALVYILWLTWYVIHNNVINNIVGSCLR